MAGVTFDAAAIRELAKILRETDLTEIELVEAENRVRVARQITVQPMAAAPGPLPPAPAAAILPSATAPEAEGPHPGTVTSPMVGVVYLAPEPGAPPFIAAGARVSQGQTLLLIEAMKTFNQIRAPKAGLVTRILVESGAPVEYGEPLLVIE
jgi:acetyl-CoA carboxylase biotin carboxyl carrier protein